MMRLSDFTLCWINMVSVLPHITIVMCGLDELDGVVVRITGKHNHITRGFKQQLKENIQCILYYCINIWEYTISPWTECIYNQCFTSPVCRNGHFFSIFSINKKFIWIVSICTTQFESLNYNYTNICHLVFGIQKQQNFFLKVLFLEVLQV